MGDAVSRGPDYKYPAMTRTVHQTNLKSGRTQEAGPKPFSDFAAMPNLVLLGDPGAGKTHVFTEAAKAEGGRFIKARAFLSMPAALLSGQALFIDGLDEQRGGRSDRAIIDELVAKLFEVNPARVRISCRIADWLGDSDLAGLQPYFEQHGETAVLLLQRLSRSEQRGVLEANGRPPRMRKGSWTRRKNGGWTTFSRIPKTS